MTIQCDVCGKKGAQIRHLTRNYGKGAGVFIIENVPVVTCPHCGEPYLTADTLQEIERIKLHKRSFAHKKQISVARFAA